MNLVTAAAGVLLTSGISSYSVLAYQKTLEAVNEIQYEPLEAVDDNTSIRDAIEIVRRNNSKRKKLIHQLQNALQQNTDVKTP